MGKPVKRDISTTWAPCPTCHLRHEPGSSHPLTGVWLDRGGPAGDQALVWLKRPMPDGQWPPQQDEPRGDSFSWWVRSHCGHQARQWAFYDEQACDQIEEAFRAAPCLLSRCPNHLIDTQRRQARG